MHVCLFIFRADIFHISSKDGHAHLSESAPRWPGNVLTSNIFFRSAVGGSNILVASVFQSQFLPKALKLQEDSQETIINIQSSI